MNKNISIDLNISIDTLRFALISDGYLVNEVIKYSDEQIIAIWTRKFLENIYKEYNASKNIINNDKKLLKSYDAYLIKEGK